MIEFDLKINIHFPTIQVVWYNRPHIEQQLPQRVYNVDDECLPDIK